MRCEATLSNDYLRIGTKSDNRCRRVASFSYRGKSRCAEHTSMALLETAKADGTIKRVMRDRKEKEYRRADDATPTSPERAG